MNNKKFYKNRDWLYRKYWVENLSIAEIGKEVGRPYATLHSIFERFNIPRRDRNEAQRLWHNNHPGVRRGREHHGWKGGKLRTSAGYIQIYSPRHPNRTKCSKRGFGGYVLEHRLVMEKNIGRYLFPWETVHHENGIKDDNRIENLELLPNQGKHNTRTQEVYKENIFLKKLVSSFLGIQT